MTTQAAIAPAGSVWRARVPVLVVWSAAVGYLCLATYFSLRRHDAFRSGIDLANFDQALWLISQGEEPVTQHGRSYWGDHFGLTPVLLAPLYLLGAGVRTLLVIQALAMAAVAPLLYALARAYGARRWPASIPALLWLASPLTLIPNLQDFHHIPFVAPVIVASILALKLDRLVLFAALALLASCAKEDVALMYVMVGVVVAIEGRRRLGAAISAAALGVFAFAVLVFIPAFTDSLDWFAARFGGDRGDSLGEVAGWMLSHPVTTLGDLVTARHLLILGALVITTGGLCLLGARWMLLGVPALVHNFLSAYPPQHQVRDHYYIAVALAFSIAAAAGVHRLATVGRRLRLAAAAGVVLAFFAFPFGVRHVDVLSEWSTPGAASTGGAVARREAVALIPADAVVAASSRLTPHLGHRKEIYALPIPFLGREEFGSDWSRVEMARRASRVEWVAFDTTERPHELLNLPELVQPLLRRLGFREVGRRGTVHVYVRLTRDLARTNR